MRQTWWWTEFDDAYRNTTEMINYQRTNYQLGIPQQCCCRRFMDLHLPNNSAKLYFLLVELSDWGIDRFAEKLSNSVVLMWCKTLLPTLWIGNVSITEWNWLPELAFKYREIELLASKYFEMGDFFESDLVKCRFESKFFFSNVLALHKSLFRRKCYMSNCLEKDMITAII